MTNALTGVLEAQADALRARLLGVPQLTREQQIELDAELSTATYISVRQGLLSVEWCSGKTALK